MTQNGQKAVHYTHEYRGQYTGSYTGAFWNAQSFFATSTVKHSEKRRYLDRLLRKMDFVCLTECHGTPGEHAALDLPLELEAFWAEGTPSRGGVGIILKKAWLDKFDVAKPIWDILVPVRVATLHLFSKQCNLDITVVYFPTGQLSKTSAQDGGGFMSLHEERNRIRVRLSQCLADPSVALSLVMGDFNTVVNADDRWNLGSDCAMGGRDATEEAHWQNVVANKLELYELRQPLATYWESQTRSRIDRVYTNQPPADQIDRNVQCAAL